MKQVLPSSLYATFLIPTRLWVSLWSKKRSYPYRVRHSISGCRGMIKKKQSRSQLSWRYHDMEGQFFFGCHPSMLRPFMSFTQVYKKKRLSSLVKANLRFSYPDLVQLQLVRIVLIRLEKKGILQYQESLAPSKAQQGILSLRKYSFFKKYSSSIKYNALFNPSKYTYSKGEYSDFCYQSFSSSQSDRAGFL